jgi:hypothetical protein
MKLTKEERLVINFSLQNFQNDLGDLEITTDFINALILKIKEGK